ncbi:conserved protein of unknown function(containing Haemerythrin-like, metal-binding domain, 1-128) [Magnetospirillum sp. XM-1]|uniref:bacteriohemerythrin n=1 Tax=Magnetospirillum sp. XM-1 TaxID=1663591 RepID=UPI00073DC9D7|nr:hemerythrin family protein [Magnetospirillum sp. XM-1]CUW40137.1 conserved protein of unknown function(containing Haemerythrin-like, metal-binding domain, 1-128) [Magnetospirillum sp. XM-1]
MVDINWQRKYEIGHPRIDFEHRIFLDLIEQFARQAESGATAKRLLRTCAELYKYADFHFFSEEGLMEEIEWPETAAHKALHRDLLKQLHDYIDSVSVDQIRTSEMVAFLMQWFVSHTGSEDRKLAHLLPSASPYKATG